MGCRELTLEVAVETDGHPTVFLRVEPLAVLSDGKQMFDKFGDQLAGRIRYGKGFKQHCVCHKLSISIIKKFKMIGGLTDTIVAVEKAMSGHFIIIAANMCSALFLIHFSMGTMKKVMSGCIE